MTAPLSDAEIEALEQWPLIYSGGNSFCAVCYGKAEMTDSGRIDPPRSVHTDDCKQVQRNACLLELRSARERNRKLTRALRELVATVMRTVAEAPC